MCLCVVFKFKTKSSSLPLYFDIYFKLIFVIFFLIDSCSYPELSRDELIYDNDFESGNLTEIDGKATSTFNNTTVLGDFNNTGSQSVTNPTLSPFADQNNYDTASSFKMTDLSILQGPATGYSWQGWTSSYDAAHFDHIIINQSMFTVDATSATSVIALPTETGLSNSNVSNRISDHQPVIYRFYPWSISLNI